METGIRATHKSVLTLQVMTVAALGLTALLAIIPAAGHDQLWFLLMAQRWIHGAVLYGPEIFDSNTPMVVWLSAIPVSLGERLGLELPTAAKLVFTLVECAVAAACFRLMRSVVRERAGRWFLLFAFVVLFGVVPARDLGQRDLLTALLCLPYLLVAAGQERRLLLRVLVVVAAAVGICLKPQQALVPLAIELLQLLQRRKVRWEPLLLLASGGVFLLAVRLFAPLYFSVALPTTLSTYWAIGHLNLLQLIGQSIELHVLLFAALLLSRRTGNDPLGRFILVFLVAACAATLAYYQQGTGWYYQQLPGIVFAGLALALELIVLARAHPVTVPACMPAAAGGLAVLALALAFHFSGYPFSLHPFTPDRTYGITSPDPSLFDGFPAGASVATLTTSVDEAIMPVFRYHLFWAQRTNNLWLLPAILRSGGAGRSRITPDRLMAVTAQQRRWMVEDLVRWHPVLVLVARCQDPRVQCQELEDRHDDLLRFFLEDPGFEEVWRGYRLVRSTPSYDAYRLGPALPHRR